MTDDPIELSRRKILAGVGTVGLAGAGAGLGTSAFFSDQETFVNNRLVAGELDMKAAYSVHYSDWSEDELDGIAEEDVTMTDHEATFEPGPTSLPGLEFATESDLQQFLDNTLVNEDGNASCPGGTDADELEQPVIDLGDVKPGDHGEVTFDLALCDNPGYIWLQVDNAHAHENGYTEPEREDPDETTGPIPLPEGLDGYVELLDAVQAAYWVDDGNNYVNGDESFASRGSLREILEELSGVGAALDGDISAEEGGGTGQQGCFSAGEHSVGFIWWLPVDHANEIQTDSVTFELGFYTEQCRHNDGSQDELTTFLTADAEFKEEPWDGTIADETGQSEVDVAVGAMTSVDTDALPVPTPPELPFAFAPQVVKVSTGTKVVWHWVDNPFAPVPHDVASLDLTGGGHNHLFKSPLQHYTDDPDPGEPTFDYTFNNPGIYLYYCHPHGAPTFQPSVFGGEVINEFGMRGAVIVED